MEDHARENLTELLRRFMDESEARAVAADLEAGERILEAHPAPAPSPGTLATIRALMIATTVRRRRRIRMFRAAVAVAAAVILMVLVAQYHRGPTPRPRPGISFASIIPTAVWESHDIAADDPDLVYFTSEIHQIEDQMQAIEAGESETRGNNALDELEMELIAIDTEFWKG